MYMQLYSIYIVGKTILNEGWLLLLKD